MSLKEEFINISNQENNDDLLNNFENKKELLTREELINNEKLNTFLYPNLNDPLFNVKISEKKEFFDTRYDGKIQNIEKQAEKLCNMDFELAPHQLFVRNFLSFQTPYNSLLLYHGLGTGKTCSAISVAEEMRDYLIQMGISQRIILVASPNVQDNFKLQLFDERKLELIDGLWNIKSCTGNKYLKEINPMNMKGLSKEKVISQIKRIINNSYLFIGYTEFANYIVKKSTIDNSITNQKQRNKIIKNKLKKVFNNRLIIIDEVHNIRTTDDNKDKRVAQELFKLVKNVDNLRLLLLSATPLYNSYKEIIWLINLMNLNDKRSQIEFKDVFDADGNFKINSQGEEIGLELLERKATGYISFIRGENPYTFPYRIWPDQFSQENTFKKQIKPSIQLNGKIIVQDLELISVYLTKLSSYQQKGYDYIINKMKNVDKTKDDESRLMPTFENMESLGYTMLQKPLEGLNIIYPYDKLNENEENFDIKELVGKSGLNRIMEYKEVINPPSRTNFRYKTQEYGRIFSKNEIGKYSSKIKNICNSILNSTGVVLVYSQYIDGGLIPIALALEELGFTRQGRTKSLFKDPPTEQIDAKTFLPKNQHSEGKFMGAQYAIITGDKSISPNNVAELKAVTNLDNKYGEKVKVVLISQAGSEGLDFKFIRQVHIMEPWYNMNRLEQIIGRAVRTCSHKDLPFIERNVQLFLYGTLLEDSREEAADLYVYRLAEMKAMQIGKVSRILKEIAIDCILNHEQTNFTTQNMKQNIEQKLSNNEIIQYQIGDKPYSSICDYMEKCVYTCKPNKIITEEDVNLDTFSEQFIMMNTDKITQRIKMLMKERYFYSKNNLISEINIIKNYPLVQINAALNMLVEDKNEYITDKYGRLGNLINIGELYLFQPIELNNNNISTFDRNRPLDYKRKEILIKLPEIIEKDSVKENDKLNTDSNIQKLLETIRNDYDKATTTQIVVRGEDDWYKFCSIVIKDMENNGVNIELLDDFLIAHIIELLNYSETLKLLNYLFTNKLNIFERKLKKYFDEKIMINKEITGLLLVNNDKAELQIFDNGRWNIAESEDYEDLSSEISKQQVNMKELNNMIGFIANFKNDYMVFKVKDMNKKRHKGARCDQSGKSDSVKILNSIINEDKYNATNTKNINQKQICVIQEFTLRLFDSIAKDDKRWFLNPEEANLTDIEKINF